MRIVVRRDGAPVDADVRIHRPDAVVGDLARALGIASPAAPDGAAGLVVEGLNVPGDLGLDEAGVHEGAVVSDRHHGPPGADPTAGSDAPLLLCVLTGVDAGVAVPLGPGSHLVGRDPEGAVVLADPTVSRRHCRIDVDDGGRARLTNLSERVGTSIAGVPVDDDTPIEAGAIVRVGNALVTLRAPERDDRPAGVDRFRDLSTAGLISLNRPPRRATAPPPAPLDAPAEPKEGRKAPFSFAALISPLLMGTVMAVFMDPRFAIFVLISPVMLLGNWIETSRRTKYSLRRDTREYDEKLARFDEALEDAWHQELAGRRAGLPDTAEVLRRAELPSVHLWERLPRHDDFLVVSAGYADLSWAPRLADERTTPGPEVLESLEARRRLPDVPVPVDLGRGKVAGLAGDRARALAAARNLVLQAAVHHGPANVRVVVACTEGAVADWDWAKWLPHVRDPRPGPGERRLLAVGVEATNDLLDGMLPDVLDRPDRRGKDWPDDDPVTLFVLDGDELLAGRNSPARRLLRQEAGPAAGIVVADTADRLPALCTAILQLTDWGGAELVEPQEGTAPLALVPAGLAEPTARRGAIALARYDDPELDTPGSHLPDLVHLAPLLGFEEIGPKEVLARWQRRDPGGNLLAPLGVTEKGPFVLDLDRYGPHGLIGGTTGSGKSELLKTLVAALAAGHPPTELTFGLFDFKGGATFNEFADLPHTVGMASDLDVSLARRAIRCLKAELHHREHVFDRAGVKDLEELRARQAAEDARAVGVGPVPRLLVIIDEFAAAAKEFDEEIKVLTDLTARGRSLGVHLILATQKPSGSVNAEIRTNTRLRISLLVEDKQDSMDVVGIPDAALIRQKGRAYFRVGSGDVVPLQTALSTGRTAAGETPPVEVVPFPFAHRPAAASSFASVGGTGGPNDLERLVRAATEAFEATGAPHPRRPWPDPLPDVLPLDELLAMDGEGRPGAVTFALADDPDAQRREPARWDFSLGNLLVYGAVGSGTTTALGTVALSFARTRAPGDGHLYVLDFGAGDLAPLVGLPHCGGVIPGGDRERTVRLVQTLRDELERRRSLAVEDRRDQPDVLVLLDNFESFRGALEDPAGHAVYEQFTRVYADGPDVGIHCAATTTRVGGIPTVLASATPTRVAARLGDRAEYGAMGIPSREVPTTMVPGRAMLTDGGRVVQVATFGDSLADAVEAVARTSVDVASPGDGPRRIDTLPGEVSRSATTARSVRRGDHVDLVVGVADRDLGDAVLRLYEHEHATIAGPARSGKSTTLVTLAEAYRTAVPDGRVLGIAFRRSPLAGAGVTTEPVAGTTTELEALVDAAMVAAAPTLVLIDDADTLDDPAGRVPALLALGRPDLHVAIAARADVLRGLFGHWTQTVRRSRAGILLQPNLDLDGDLVGTVLPRRVHVAMGPGRGFVVSDGTTELVQVAR